MEGPTDRPTDGLTDGLTDRPTDELTDGHSLRSEVFSCNFLWSHRGSIGSKGGHLGEFFCLNSKRQSIYYKMTPWACYHFHFFTRYDPILFHSSDCSPGITDGRTDGWTDGPTYGPIEITKKNCKFS